MAVILYLASLVLPRKFWISCLVFGFNYPTNATGLQRFARWKPWFQRAGKFWERKYQVQVQGGSRLRALCQADDRFQVGSRKNLAPYSERDYDCSQPGAEQIRFFRHAIPVWHLSDSPDTWQGLPG